MKISFKPDGKTEETFDVLSLSGYTKDHLSFTFAFIQQENKKEKDLFIHFQNSKTELNQSFIFSEESAKALLPTMVAFLSTAKSETLEATESIKSMFKSDDLYIYDKEQDGEKNND